MAQQPTSSSGGGQDSALEREDKRLRAMTTSGSTGEPAKERKQGPEGLNNPAQVEQDTRNDKARADAKAEGGGPDAPESGLNQDG